MLRPLLEETTGDFRPILASLAAAVLLLLVAAAVNTTHLTSSRWADTAGDQAIRVALGAGRAAVIGPVVVEGAILGLGGGLVGYGVAEIAVGYGLSAFPDVVPRVGEVAMGTGLAVAMAAAGTALGVGISLVGFGAVRGGGPTSGRLGAAERIGGWRAQGLISVQTAAAVALLASAGLLSRSIWSLTQVDLGFEAERIATVRIAQPDARMRSYPERIAVYEGLRARVAALPGISEATLAAQSPLAMGRQAGLRVEGWDRPDPPGNVSWAPVHPRYFQALGIALLSGRTFDDSDRRGSQEVAIVSRALARSVFPGQDPLGRVVTIGLDGHDRPLTIIGVVADTRSRGPAAPPGPVLYRPLAQTDGFPGDAVLLIARTGGADRAGRVDPGDRADPADLARIQETLRAARPDLPVYDAAVGVELAASFRTGQTSLLGIVGIFALAATLLAAVGVYGVTAHATRRRRREIGVRMALGADRRRVLRSVLGRGLVQATLGIPFGLLATLGVGGGLRSLLVGVEPHDPAVLAAVCGVVLVVTASALLAPAWDAARTDPAVATRAD